MLLSYNSSSKSNVYIARDLMAAALVVRTWSAVLLIDEQNSNLHIADL